MALDNNTQLNYTDKTTIKNWFKTGLKPTQTQFWATWDSYFHKGELIPISSVSGLGNLLDGKAEVNHTHYQYATNDATSLTAEDVTAWKNKLGVANLEFNDEAIKVTSDYNRFNLRVGASQSAFNSCVDQEFGLVIYKPTEAGTVTEFPYVVGIDAEGNSAKLPAADLGKNFANTDLVVLSNRKHTGTATVEFGFPFFCSNASVRYSGLVDKSADATYNALMGLDSGGNLAKLTALGNVLESGLQTVSSAQALRIGQLLNGGQGSAGALNVTSITPPVVDRLYNVDEVVVLRGTNLKLNAVSMGISILNSENNEVAIIPNNSINIYDDGLSLVFTYNFSQLGIGEYRLKIISGTKILITSVNIIVLENIESINLSNLTWDILKSPELTNNDIVVASGQSLATELRIAKDTNLPVYSLKSSEVFSQGDDFYMTGNMSVTKQDWTGANTLLAQLSLVYSNIVNDTLNYRGLVSININRTSNSNRFNITTNIDSRQITFESPSGSVNSDFFLMKQGNLITIRIGNTIWQTSIINNSGYSFMYAGPAKNYTFDRYLSTSVNFTRAFKF